MLVHYLFNLILEWCVIVLASLFALHRFVIALFCLSMSLFMFICLCFLWSIVCMNCCIVCFYMFMTLASESLAGLRVAPTVWPPVLRGSVAEASRKHRGSNFSMCVLWTMLLAFVCFYGCYISWGGGGGNHKRRTGLNHLL